MTLALRHALALLLAIAVTVLSSGAAAQGAQDAGAHFDRGVSFFKDGDYTAAMVEFKKAYEIDPNYRVLYNLGQTSRELRDYASALRSFERYLEEGANKIDAERRKRVESWVVELRGKIGNVTLATNVDGAEVSIDDVPVGTTPLDKAVVVNAGRRKLSLVKSGYTPRTQYVDVAGTEAKSIRLDLVPLTAAAAEGPRAKPDDRAPAPPPPAREPRGTARPWVMLGVTGAVGVAAVVVGGIALSKKSDFEDALEGYPTTAESVEDTRDGARAFAAAADVLTAVAVASGVATIVLFATDRSSSASAAAKAPPRAEARVVVGPGAVRVSGSF
jgi:tetratricopeptide (TPR) repeat protein